MVEIEKSAVRAWLDGPDVGRSSRALVLCLTHDTNTPVFEESREHSHDVADLARCARALKTLPFLQSQLERATTLSPIWASLVTRWDDLIEILREEYLTGYFPKTAYALTRLLKAGEKNEFVTGRLLDGYLPGEHKRRPEKNTAPFYLGLQDLNMASGMLLEAAAHVFKAIEINRSSPCRECGKKRICYMDSVYGPTIDKDLCDPCSRKKHPLEMP